MCEYSQYKGTVCLCGWTDKCKSFFWKNRLVCAQECTVRRAGKIRGAGQRRLDITRQCDTAALVRTPVLKLAPELSLSVSFGAQGAISLRSVTPFGFIYNPENGDSNFLRNGSKPRDVISQTQ